MGPVALPALAVLLVLVVGLLIERFMMNRQARVLTTLHHAELVEAQRRAQAQAMALTRYTRDVVLVVDPTSRILAAGGAYEDLLAHPTSRLIGRLLTTMLPPQATTSVLRALAVTSDSPTRLRLGVHRPDGSTREAEVTIVGGRDSSGVGGAVVILRDLSERDQDSDERATRTLHDPVTGLANLRLFTERLGDVLVSRPGAEPVCVLVCDVADFRWISNQHSDELGDEVLARVVDRLADLVPRGATMARLAGDEIAVLLDDGDVRYAQDLARRLVTEADEPMTVRGRVVGARLSIGVAHAIPGVHDAKQALSNAEVAMHCARGGQRSRVALHDSTTRRPAAERALQRSDFERAISSDELRLDLQPVINLTTGEVDGFEALARWTHPRRGELMPDEFVPIAEHTGMIVALGSWVIDQAAGVAAGFEPGPRGPSVSVNVATHQLSQSGFVDDVLQVLERSGLRADRLILEITESAVLNSLDEAGPRLTRLRDLGVRIAIDDFGTGHSNLSCLSRLPVDILKIDKSFIDRLLHDPQCSSIVRGVLDMSADLGLVTVAEGVEDAEQAEWLRAAGCRFGQGYLWSRPIPLGEAESLLAAYTQVPSTPNRMMPT